MARQRVVSATFIAASATAVCASQSAAGAANLIINGGLATAGVATFDAARRVRITSAGNDSSITFTITGTDRWTNVQTEVVTGANTSTADSKLDFKTVTKIATSGATASTVTVGNNTTGSTAWVPLDHYGVAPVTLTGAVTGTVTYTVEFTDDNVMNSSGPFTVINSPDTNIVNATGNQYSTVIGKPGAIRATVSSGTGKVVLTVLELGMLSV